MSVTTRPGLSRRQCLAAALAACAGAAHAQAAGAASPGYRVSDWPAQRATPPLQAVGLEGQPVRLDDFKGRVLLLNFWATWCPPCRAELPSLQALPEWFGEDKVAVLALNFRESGRTARRFLSSSGIQVPVALNPSGDIAKAWGVRAFPTTVLIDRGGQARQVVQGEVDWLSAPALAWVERLLGQR